jgi:hypothetical protein
MAFKWPMSGRKPKLLCICPTINGEANRVVAFPKVAQANAGAEEGPDSIGQGAG